jgi:hypothetical protein
MSKLMNSWSELHKRHALPAASLLIIVALPSTQLDWTTLIRLIFARVPSHSIQCEAAV